MSTKKKKDEVEAPPPESCLPPGYTISCDVYWVGDSYTIEDSGEFLKLSTKGNLVAVPELGEFDREDGTKGFFVEFVQVEFEGIAEPQKVPIKSVSLEPAPLEWLDELSTGIKLPIKGRDVEQLWAVKDDFVKQAELLTKLLRLEVAYPVLAQREIVCDFHIFNLAHAKSICLGTLQAAVFIAIMDRMLEMMKGESVGPHTRPQDVSSISDCFKEFERLILLHAMKKPPERLDIFKGTEVRLLSDFASTTLFKHFLLHQYCLNFDREVETMHVSIGLDRPWAPADLLDLKAAKERPKKAKEEPGLLGPRTGSTDEAAEGGEATQEDSPAVEELSPEEEVERLVAQKLEETKAKLEAKLQNRESSFFERLEQQSQAKKAGKK